MHKLRYSTSVREEVSGCSAQRPGGVLAACRGKITHIDAAGPPAVPGAVGSHLPVPQCLPKWVLCPNPQPTYVQQQWGGNESVLGASTEQNCMSELCCFTVALINRIIKWLGLEGALKIVEF